MKRQAIVLAGALLLAANVGLAQAPSDAEIAAIVVTANQVDIDAGNLARVPTSTSGNVNALRQRGWWPSTPP